MNLRSETFVALQFLARTFAVAEALLATVVIVEEFAPENRGWGIGAAAAIQATSIAIEKIQRSIAADKAVKSRGSRRSLDWEFLGPDRLEVDRLGTQTYIKGTEWSGRVTALAVDPRCNSHACTLYAKAAGGVDRCATWSMCSPCTRPFTSLPSAERAL